MFNRKPKSKINGIKIFHNVKNVILIMIFGE